MWIDSLAPLRPGAPPAGRALDAAAFRPFRIGCHAPAGHPQAVEEGIAATLPYGQMRLFHRAGGTRRALVVAPLAGGFPVLMRDLVAGLLDHAGDVAITDWPDARYVPADRGRFGFDENCLETAQMIRAMGPGTHVVGVCQGVVPALAASALLARDGAAPASLTLIGGPVDCGESPTRLDRLLGGRPARELADRYMEDIAAPFPGAGRRVFPRQREMQVFGMYLWRQSWSGGELPMKLLLDDGSDPLRYPLARLCWDMMDIPADFFLENIARVFQERALPRGVLEVAGRRVEPQALTSTVLLTVEGGRDDISAPGQTSPAHHLCSGLPVALKHHLPVPEAGHFSLFYGSRMRRHILPAIAAAMAQAEAR